jgi:hypothetical protein
MNKFFLLFIFIPIFIFTTSCNNFNNTQTQNNKEKTSSSAISPVKPFSYSEYGEVLKKYVNKNGLVNYKQLQNNRQQLDSFIQSLAVVNPKTYEFWTEQEKIAFWINSYNALTLKSIIDQNPLKNSIKDIPGVWRIRKFDVLGQSLSLNNIEHDILRKDFDEPRIHVALVCAAISCPPLRNEPYTESKLNQQLDNQVRQFITNNQGFRLDTTEGKIYLSSIFKWYGDDWSKKYQIEDKFSGNEKERAVLNFLTSYLSVQDRHYLEQGNYKITYLKYDWSLNQQ